MAKSFDDTELLDRVDGEIGFLAETVQMLESDGRSLMRGVQTALAAGDTPYVGRTAHTLKERISNFCEPGVHALALEVEREGKPGDCAVVAVATARLAPALEALITELSQFIKTRS